jgi:hypothetical protein
MSSRVSTSVLPSIRESKNPLTWSSEALQLVGRDGDDQDGLRGAEGRQALALKSPPALVRERARISVERDTSSSRASRKSACSGFPSWRSRRASTIVGSPDAGREARCLTSESRANASGSNSGTTVGRSESPSGSRGARIPGSGVRVGVTRQSYDGGGRATPSRESHGGARARAVVRRCHVVGRRTFTP